MQHNFDAAEWRVTEPGIMETDRYLSSANAPDFEEDVRLCIESGARDMVLNCANLTYVTGAGLRTLLNIAGMMEKVGGELAVAGLQAQPLDMFMATGMDTVIPFADAGIVDTSVPDWA